MPNSDITLLSRARRRTPANPEVRDCWNLVLRGIELGWLDRSELRELIQHLRAHRDFGVEELLFANVGERLRVSFLDEAVECSPTAMMKELEAISR